MHIKNILNKLFTEQTHWQGYLLTQWPLILGSLKDHVTLEKMHQDTIVVSVSNSSWLHELYMLSDMLKDKINSHLPTPQVKTIRFIIKQRKQVQETRTVKNTAQPHIQHEKHQLTMRQEQALQRLSEKNPSLADAAQTYLYKCISTRKYL